MLLYKQVCILVSCYHWYENYMGYSWLISVKGVQHGFSHFISICSLNHSFGTSSCFQFYKHLPRSYHTFKSDMHQLFPTIYDTKLIAAEIKSSLRQADDKGRKYLVINMLKTHLDFQFVAFYHISFLNYFCFSLYLIYVFVSCENIEPFQYFTAIMEVVFLLHWCDYNFGVMGIKMHFLLYSF